MSVNFLDPSTNPFQQSEIRRLQDFYGATYEDLWDKQKLKDLWMKQEEIEYCLENRDKEFSLKSTEWFELREWVTTTKRFIKLQEFYGFSLHDTQSIDILKDYGLNDDDIEFITGKTLTKPKETTKITPKTKTSWVTKKVQKKNK